MLPSIRYSIVDQIHGAVNTESSAAWISLADHLRSASQTILASTPKPRAESAKDDISPPGSLSKAPPGPGRVGPYKWQVRRVRPAGRSGFVPVGMAFRRGLFLPGPKPEHRTPAPSVHSPARDGLCPA